MKQLIILVLFIFCAFGSFAKTNDSLPPQITLNGATSMVICQWGKYIDPGYTLTDKYFALIDIKIDSVGFPINTNNPGLQKIQYKATDKSGKYAFSETRYIMVYPSYSINCGGPGYPTDTTGHSSAIKPNMNLDKNIEIYPNPSSGSIYISMKSHLEISSVSIYNINGQIVSHKNASDLSFSKGQLDITDQPNGIYFARIEMEGGNFVKKLVLRK